MPLKNVSLYLFINTWSAPSYTSTEVAVQREGQRCPYSRVAEAALWATLTLCCRQDMRGPRDCGSTHADTSNAATDCYWNNTKMCVLSLPGRLSFQGCICPSASKRSPSSLPLEPSSVQSHGNAAVTALQTFLYRLFKGSLRLSSAEQEVGPLEHEPAVCSCSIESQEHPEHTTKSTARRPVEGILALSTGETGLEHCVQVWAPQHDRDRETLERALWKTIISGVVHLPYKERLREMGLLSLERAHRGPYQQPKIPEAWTLFPVAPCDRRQWAQTETWNSTENKQFFTAGGDKSIGTGCPVRLWILDPWEIFKTQPDIAHGNLLQLTLLWAGEMD